MEEKEKPEMDFDYYECRACGLEHPCELRIKGGVDSDDIQFCPIIRTGPEPTWSPVLDPRRPLMEALKEYGDHKLTCGLHAFDPRPCDCGWKEALKTAGEKA